MPSSTIKYIVDNQTGLAAEQTIYNNLTIDGNVNITGTTNIRPYKVFTALLTQSGTSSSQDILYSGDEPVIPPIVGVTYEITQFGDDIDFTLIGSPDNNVGTKFIATSTVVDSGSPINPSELTYYPGAPTAIVLENTIGNIWFTFQSDGQYYANSDGLFIDNKTATFGGYYDADLGVGFRFGNAGYDSINQVFLRTNDGPPTNGYLQNDTIEIRVYN